jgi:hypothetical protein
MKAIHGDRRSGKTTKLIELSSKEELTIICISRRHVDLVSDQARKMVKNIPQPFTFDQLLSGKLKGRHIKGFLFDDLDAMLQTLCDSPVYAISFSD